MPDNCTWNCDSCIHNSVCFHTKLKDKIFTCHQELKRDKDLEFRMINALKQCAKEHKDDVTPTFKIRVADLCTDVARYLETI